MNRRINADVVLLIAGLLLLLYYEAEDRGWGFFIVGALVAGWLIANIRNRMRSRGRDHSGARND